MRSERRCCAVHCTVQCIVLRSRQDWTGLDWTGQDMRRSSESGAHPQLVRRWRSQLESSRTTHMHIPHCSALRSSSFFEDTTRHELLPASAASPLRSGRAALAKGKPFLFFSLSPLCPLQVHLRAVPSLNTPRQGATESGSTASRLISAGYLRSGRL